MSDAGPLTLADMPHRHPDRQTIGVRTMRLAEMHQRIGAPWPARPLRLAVQLIALITAGRDRIIVDFDEYPCRPGGLLWVRPGQLITLPQPGLDATLVFFDRDATTTGGSAAHTRVAFPPGQAYWQPTGEDEEAIVDAVSQLETDYHRALAGEPIQAELLARQLSVLVLRVARLAYPGAGAGAAHPVLVRFQEAIEQRFATCRQVDVYADVLGCSVRTLTRASLAGTGRTAKQLIDDRVALEAKRMLVHSDLPVAEVAARLGFTEPTNFGRFFSRTVGVSPGHFRASGVSASDSPGPATGSGHADAAHT